MSKYAFKLPGNPDKVLTVDPQSFESARLPVKLADAQREGCAILDWPICSITDRPVPAHELGQHLPQATTASQDDPATVAAVTRLVQIASAVNEPGAYDHARTLAATDLDVQTARAFLRGLPAASDLSTNANQKETSDMALYRNQPEDEKSKIRALEIRMNNIGVKAAAGDPAAKAKLKEVRYAKTVAQASGKHLWAVMAELGITV